MACPILSTSSLSSCSSASRHCLVAPSAHSRSCRSLCYGSRSSALSQASSNPSQPGVQRGMACSASSQRDLDAPLVPSGSASGNGTFVLMLLCVCTFVLDNVLHVPGMRCMYLYNSHPHWWQYVTHQFCHANLAHLSANLFQLCVFGRFVEETEGAWGVIIIFLLTGLGAAIATTWFMPGSVSVGASGSIFGLFATSVLLRLLGGLNLKLLLEAVVLGNFVVQQMMQETRMQFMGGAAHGGLQVAHIAHLAGALAGVFLVLAVLSGEKLLSSGGKSKS